MKRRFVNRLLAGVATVAVSASSLAAPMMTMAAPEDDVTGFEVDFEDEVEFGDVLEEAFEEEAEEEYVEDYVEEVDDVDDLAEMEYGEDPELLQASAVTSISGLPSEITVHPYGDDYKIDLSKVRFTPSDSTQKLTWTSSDEELVKVYLHYTHYTDSTSTGNQLLFINNTGKTGTATIAVKSEDGSYTGSIKVHVLSEEAQGLSLEDSYKTIYLLPGMEKRDILHVTPVSTTTAHGDYRNSYTNTLIKGTVAKSGIVALDNGCALGREYDDSQDDHYTNFHVYGFDVTGAQAGTTSITYTLKEGSKASVTRNVTVLPADTVPLAIEKDEYTFHVGEGGTKYGIVTDRGNGSYDTETRGEPYKIDCEPCKAYDGVSISHKGAFADDLHVLCDYEYKNGEILLWPGDQGGTITLVITPSYTWRVGSDYSQSDHDREKEITVNVLPPVTAVTGVSLNKTTTTIQAGKTEKLVATVSPEDATNSKVTWSSSDTAVATVAEDGTVTAKAPGTALITVKTEDGSFEKSCAVSVTAAEVKVTGVSLNKTSVELIKGETVTLAATVTPADATNQNVAWTSSNTSVATVNADGKVTAVAAGTATITVTTADGSKTATCTVTVGAPAVAVTGVALDKTTATLEAGESVTLTATVAPSNATNQDVTWISNNTSVATVDANGKVIAVAAGNATITVKTADGEKTATCSVTVKAESVAVNGVSIDKKEVELKISDTVQLTAVVSPADADYQKINWKSDDPAVANVDSTGKVTALTAGSTTIRATVVEAGGRDYLYNASCKVTVTGQETSTAEKTTEAINNLPSASDVKPEDKNAIEQAKEQYDNLPKSEQEKVAPEVVQKLNDAIAALESALEKKETEDIAAAKAVTDLINALPSADQITEANKDAVQAAKEAFEKLTDDQKAKLDNETVNKLAEAVEELKDIIAKTDEEKAEAVAEQISNLPAASDVTKENQQEIEQAKQDFENLTESQKALIDDETIKKLEDAIAALEELIKIPAKGETLIYNEETGLWDYYVDGVNDKNAYKFIDYEGYKFIIANGTVAPVNGLVMDPQSDLWYFCAEGQVCKHTGLVMYNEEWFYINEGILNTKLNALVPYNGGLFYVAAGRITREVSGLVLDPNSPDWYFVALGEVQNQYTGLATYDGKWFYVINGKLAVDYTGMVTYDGDFFNVVNGMVY